MGKINIIFLSLIFILIPFLAKADLTSDYHTLFNSLEQQIIDIKAQYYKDVDYIKQTTDASDQQDQMIQQATDDANAKITQVQSQEQQLNTNYQDALSKQQAQQQQQQQQTCPPNSHNSNGQCLCDDGYLVSNNACATYNQVCQNQYGANSYGDKTNCYCNAGYQLNASKTACVNIVCPANSSLSGKQCLCRSGYVADNNACITADQWCQNQYGPNSYADKKNCYCSAGYQWSPSEKSCLKTEVETTNPPPDQVPDQAQPSQIQMRVEDLSPTLEPLPPDNNQPEQQTAAVSADNKTGFFQSIFNFFINLWKSIFK